MQSKEFMKWKATEKYLLDIAVATAEMRGIEKKIEFLPNSFYTALDDMADAVRRAETEYTRATSELAITLINKENPQ